jgi:hypothetical protein
MPVNFSWLAFNQKKVEEICFSYSNTSLKSSTQKETDLTDFSAQSFNFSYGYQRALFQPKNVSFYAGAKLNTYVAIRELSYQISQLNTTLSDNSADMFASINLSLSADINLEENLLYFDASYSILSYLITRYYDREQESENSFLFFPTFNALSFSANYYHKITSKLYLSLAYKFYYYSYPRSGDILVTKGMHNQLVAGLNLKF